MAVRHHGGGRFVAAGGHLPIYLVRRDGQVSAVEVPGPWCGLLPDIEPQLDERAIELQVGDLLCLVTDGVLEARDQQGECYGDERLLEALGRLRAQPADQVLAQVLSEVRSFQRAQEDDITAVLLKRTA
jgi:sigma-B regulation protein RsbU (phosphoserine phosphatase)